MTNFKGTKGKWVVTSQDQVVRSEEGYAIAASPALFLENDWKANALLISKAPEMLEMLEKLVNTYELLGLSNEVKQLIKEATEL
jgi:hypothetical protein